MKINNVEFNTDLYTILVELQKQLRINGINYLMDLKDSGNDVMISCPFHNNGEEKHASAGIRKSDGLFHCFTCNKVVSLPEVISYCFGKNDVGGFYGWNWLLKNFSSISSSERKPIELSINRKENINEQVTYISEEELDSYRYYHPYMFERKLDYRVIELFDIGYDNKTNCITFPIRNIDGKTYSIARRSVVSKYFNYPSNSIKPVYGLYEITKSYEKYPETIIICESMLDALVFWTVGKVAVALNGVGSSLQFKQLNSLPCRKFILCTDMDKAGLQARKNLRKELRNKIITEYILPKGCKDANDCTREQLLNLEEVF